MAALSIVFVAIFVTSTVSSKAAEKVPVIFDTDVGTDFDDSAAIARAIQVTQSLFHSYSV